MTAQLDDSLFHLLATDSGLFHRTPSGDVISRALTLVPLRALAESIVPGMRTLETGCGGTSVTFAAAGARHTVITPDRTEVDRVREFCALNGISLDAVDFRLGSSDRILGDWEEPLDAVLVDGAHRMPFPFLDWHFTAPHLKLGGKFLLDDVPIPAVHLLFDFLRGEPEWRLLAVHADKFAIFEKIAELPDPASDWEAQRFNLPWIYDHVPLRRRWRRARDRAMIRTRMRRSGLL